VTGFYADFALWRKGDSGRSGEKLSFPTPYKFTAKTKRGAGRAPAATYRPELPCNLRFRENRQMWLSAAAVPFAGRIRHHPSAHPFSAWSRGRTENRFTLFLAALRCRI
jgi:hypothetical protein